MLFKKSCFLHTSRSQIVLQVRINKQAVGLRKDLRLMCSTVLQVPPLTGSWHCCAVWASSSLPMSGCAHCLLDEEVPGGLEQGGVEVTSGHQNRNRDKDWGHGGCCQTPRQPRMSKCDSQVV